MNGQRPISQIQLDDILQDPNTSWSQIREAMKSSRGCTNAAIMGAIANGRGGVTNFPDSGDKEKLADPGVGCDNAASILCNGLKERTVQAIHAPLNDNEPQDITNSQNRRPSRRSGARILSKSKNSSVRRSQRLKKSESHGSVDLMDFGVNHDMNMSTLNESLSFDGELLFGSSMRRSSRMQGSLDASDNSSSGFLGWNHHDNADDTIQSSMRSTFSSLVDSSGFLDWDRKTSRPNSPVNGLTSSKVGGLALSRSLNGLTAAFGHGQLDRNPNEHWNIEDYENPQDNNLVDFRRHPGRLFTKRLERLSGLIRSDIPTPAVTRGCKNDEIHMNEIKEALIKVSNKAGDGQKSTQRVTCCENNGTARFCAANIKETMSKAPTAIGLPFFLRGDGTDGSKSLPQEKETLNIASMLGDCKSGESKKEGLDIKKYREAIRINRQDGDVDIEKECRKIYA